MNQLNISALIGTLPNERLYRQALTVDVEISADMRRAAASDDLNDAVDYSSVEQKIVTLVENSSFQLLESLASAVGEAVTGFPGVRGCRVRIDKAAASKSGRSVAVEIEFSGKEQQP